MKLLTATTLAPFNFAIRSLSRNTYQERLRDMALRRLDNLSANPVRDKVSTPTLHVVGADKSL